MSCRRVAIIAFIAQSIAVTQAIAAADSLMLRSDLPLWSEVDEGVWPRDCSTETSIAAKCSIFATGDWQRKEANCTGDDSDCTTWVRLEITAVFHARFGYSVASDQAELDNARSDISIITLLREQGPSKLLALQVGLLGGSRYILLAAGKQGASHPYQQLTILDPVCDQSIAGVHVRKAKFLSAYRTEYCVADSKAALRKLAIVALNRPPLATLDWVAYPKDQQRQ